jgi:hypothetical protein
MAGSSPYFCEQEHPSQLSVGLTEMEEVRLVKQRYDFYIFLPRQLVGATDEGNLSGDPLRR